jgi:hypothetical protein
MPRYATRQIDDRRRAPIARTLEDIDTPGPDAPTAP